MGVARGSGPVTGRSFRAVIGALLAAEFTSAFELTMVYAAMKDLIAHFGDPVGVGWLITAYLLISAASAAICGRLGDIFGRRRVLLIMLGLAMAGSILSALSSSLTMVIAGRAVQGFAGAILPLCYGLIRENLEGERVPYGVGILASSILIASAAGMVVGGLLVDGVGWRGIFVASASMAAISMLLCVILLPPSHRAAEHGRLDIVGGLLFVPAIFCLLLAVSNVTSPLWSLGKLVAASAIGCGMLLIWIWHELRTHDPLIDLRLLMTRDTALANLAMAFFALGPLQVQLIVLLLQQSPATGIGLGMSATGASMIGLPSQILALILTPLVAAQCSRRGGKPVLAAAGLSSLAAMILLLFLHHHVGGVVATYMLIALASMAIYASVPNIVVAATPATHTSGSTGLLQVSRALAQGIGSQVVASLLASSTIPDRGGKGAFPAPDAYQAAMIFMAVAAGAIILCALAVRRREEAMPEHYKVKP